MSDFNKPRGGDPFGRPEKPYIHDELDDPTYFDDKHEKASSSLRVDRKKFQTDDDNHHDYDKFRVGDEDLFPGNPGKPGNKGGLVGPSHPMFGPSVNDPYYNSPFHKDERDYNRPKNARFDPFGPPEPDLYGPNKSNRTNYGPNPDIEKPPQFYSRDMYM